MTISTGIGVAKESVSLVRHLLGVERPYFVLSLTNEPKLGSDRPPYLYLENIGKSSALRVEFDPLLDVGLAYDDRVTFERVDVIRPQGKQRVLVHCESITQAAFGTNYLGRLSSGRHQLTVRFQDTSGRRYRQCFEVGANGVIQSKVHREIRKHHPVEGAWSRDGMRWEQQ